MNQPFRLADGGCIDRTQPLAFSFDGRALQGYAGDTLASALLANGVRMVARSFKFHRPRGIYSAGEEEPTGFVEIGDGPYHEPNCRAPLVPLTAGLAARSQSGWPGLRFDLGRIVDLTHPLWPAGFYNKTFMWPRWTAWEGIVRRMTGFGRAPEEPDPDHYEHVNVHCDLLVCGGGPAGLMAALVAGRAGARVILAEQDRQFGGSLNGERAELDGRPAAAWVDEVFAELGSLPRVMVLPATTVTGIYDGNITTLLQRGEGTAWRECFWTVRPHRVLLATGAIEQGLVFPGNDRPGIMLAGAVRHYLNRYAVAAGRTAVIATNNDSAYQTAFDLAERGIPVAAVADLRSGVREALRHRLEALGVSLHTGARIGTTHGWSGLSSIRIESLDGRPLARYRCDLLGVSGGWSARLHLCCHARGKLRFDIATQSFLPAAHPPGLEATGAAAGCWGLAATLAAAQATASGLCQQLGLTARLAHRPQPGGAPVEPGETPTAPPRPTRRRQWIDLAHDVTCADAELAVREGYVSVEHFKRYTTTGMSVDQGKTGNLNAFLALAGLTGKPVEEIGTTTFRPPYMPVSLGAVAGRRGGDFYAPRRNLAAQVLHEALGARFEDYGGWQRPECFPRPGETPDAALRREVLAVRRAVGVFDNSPLGKIEVWGPDAAEFLDRCYINDVHGLATGRCRYGLMLNDNGVIIDDGVVSRLEPGHFLVNTTSSGAARIAALFEEHRQCDWPDLRVIVANVTAQWANFTVAGPRARELLQVLDPGVDLAPAALPHMAVACGTWRGLPARIVRVSFSGEQSFEINVPASHASLLLESLLEAGRPLGIAPYGIEALMILRLEKGYLHVGSDTSGETTPDDVGWGRIARAKRADYIGRRSLFRAANEDANRKQLVGIEFPAGESPPFPGSHLLIGAGRQPPAPTDGWITSSAYSPTLERPIALAMLRAGRSRVGATVTVIDGDDCRPGRVVAPAFLDPANERLHA